MRAKFFVFFICFVSSITTFSQSKMVKVNIDSLIGIMSIEEKVGQMTQIDLGVVAQGDICKLKNPQVIDNDKLKNAILKYHIGSILNVGCGSGTISMENWRLILGQIHAENKRSSRLNIPIVYGIDAIHGANYTMGATLFPQEIGQAATWNPSLVEKAYKITAYETRASGLPWNFSPVLDLGRQPLWSRFFETFGEDVLLSKNMAKAAIRGLEGDSVNSPYQVAACMKHFLGYSMPLSGKDRTPAWISERELREYFLPSFEEAIKQGAKTVMINSGEINGTPVHINYDLLTKLLREELGFKGVAVTDWEDIYKLVSIHHVAENKKEAVKMAILAGIDMSMTPNDFEFTTLLVELVKEGLISEERINESVRRILQLKLDLGLFTQTMFAPNQYPLFGSKQHAEVSYQVAAESMTLLKNKNHVLPLGQEKEKIFICGPAAKSLNLLNGAWTHTWQGVDTTFNTPQKFTILSAMQKNSVSVTYAPGCTVDSILDIEKCFEKAKLADKIVICLGETPSTEMPGNIDNLYLTEAQQKLVLRLSETKKPIILVCCFNRPRIIQNLESKVDGILYAYLPGDEGGRAISDVLFGIVNPSGKIPFTYPSNANAFIHYDHKGSEDLAVDFSMKAYQPQFDFGVGLSYTNFTYSEFSISNTTMQNDDSVIIKVNVTNTGKIKGQEVVQVYYHDMVASITPAVKKLLGFRKISLNPMQTTEVSFCIHKNDLSFINKELKRVTEKGEFEIIINSQKKSLYVN